jgi:hypothetical protein
VCGNYHKLKNAMSFVDVVFASSSRSRIILIGCVVGLKLLGRREEGGRVFLRQDDTKMTRSNTMTCPGELSLDACLLTNMSR